MNINEKIFKLIKAEFSAKEKAFGNHKAMGVQRIDIEFEQNQMYSIRLFKDKLTCYKFTGRFRKISFGDIFQKLSTEIRREAIYHLDEIE